MRRTSRRAALGLCVALAACGQMVQYTDELSDTSTGRSLFVTAPATLGGSAGFLVGIPIGVVLLPVTYTVYAYQKVEDPLTADPMSTMLFPSFVCWRAGKFLLGVPFDAVEFAAYRMWLAEPTLSREEREAREYEYDEKLLPSYPVDPIYPTGEWRRKAEGQKEG